MSNGTRPLVVQPGEGTTLRNPVGGPLTYKAQGDQTGGSLTVLESVIPPGEGPPLHLHAHEDECLYVVEGDLRFKLDGEMAGAPPGAFVFVPRGTPHTFQNVGDRDALMLVIFTPAGMERFFEEFARVQDAQAVPEAFRSIGREAGMDVLGPPLARSDPR